MLERRFATLVDASGVSYADYARDTALLLRALGASDEHADSGQPG